MKFDMFCRGVTVPTLFMDFYSASTGGGRGYGAMAISKNEIHVAISSPVGLKFCTFMMVTLRKNWQ